MQMSVTLSSAWSGGNTVLVLCCALIGTVNFQISKWKTTLGGTAVLAAAVAVTFPAAGVCDCSTSLAAVQTLASCSQTVDHVCGCGPVASRILLVQFWIQTNITTILVQPTLNNTSFFHSFLKCNRELDFFQSSRLCLLYITVRDVSKASWVM